MWIVIMPTLSSLVALQVVMMTTCSATNDDKVGIITNLTFQWPCSGSDKFSCLAVGQVTSKVNLSYVSGNYLFRAAIKSSRSQWVNTLRLRQNGCHFADNIFKCIFLNKNVWIVIDISLKFVLKSQINNILSLVQIMAWHWPGDKPLSESMMVSYVMHICITRPQ